MSTEMIVSLIALWYQLDTSFDQLQIQLSHSQRQCEDHKNMIRRMQTRLDETMDRIGQDTTQ